LRVKIFYLIENIYTIFIFNLKFTKLD